MNIAFSELKRVLIYIRVTRWSQGSRWSLAWTLRRNWGNLVVELSIRSWGAWRAWTFTGCAILAWKGQISYIWHFGTYLIIFYCLSSIFIIFNHKNLGYFISFFLSIYLFSSLKLWFLPGYTWRARGSVRSRRTLLASTAQRVVGGLTFRSDQLGHQFGVARSRRCFSGDVLFEVVHLGFGELDVEHLAPHVPWPGLAVLHFSLKILGIK